MLDMDVCMYARNASSAWEKWRKLGLKGTKRWESDPGARVYKKCNTAPLSHMLLYEPGAHAMGTHRESELLPNTHGSVVLTEELLAGIHFHFVRILCSLFLGAKDRDHLSLCFSYRLVSWDLKKKSQSHLFVEHAVFNSRLCAVLLPFILLVTLTGNIDWQTNKTGTNLNIMERYTHTVYMEMLWTTLGHAIIIGLASP